MIKFESMFVPSRSIPSAASCFFPGWVAAQKDP